jgi:hypothetical protein
LMDCEPYASCGNFNEGSERIIAFQEVGVGSHFSEVRLRREPENCSTCEPIDPYHSFKD